MICRIAAIATAFSFASAGAFADTYFVGSAGVVSGAWSLVPIMVDDGSGQPPLVHSFLALEDKNVAVPGNIVSVWYIHNRAADTWPSQAWSTEDQWKAINTVTSQLGLINSAEAKWPTADINVVGSMAVEVPSNYDSGVLQEDPLASLLALSPNRDELVNALVALGWKAADLPIEKQENSTNCADGTAKSFLDDFALGIEMEYAGAGGTPGAAMASIAAARSVNCMWCLPYVTWTAWGFWSPYTCNWAYDSRYLQGPNRRCVYKQECCRQRTRTQVSVAPNCTTTSITETMDECWTPAPQLICTSGGADPMSPCPPVPECVGSPPLVPPVYPVPPMPVPAAPPTGTPTWFRCDPFWACWF